MRIMTVFPHLHGYDIEKAVKPGGVAEFSFEAYATDRFPINVHGGQQAGGRGGAPRIWNRGDTPRWPPGGRGEPALPRLEVSPR